MCWRRQPPASIRVLSASQCSVATTCAARAALADEQVQWTADPHVHWSRWVANACRRVWTVAWGRPSTFLAACRNARCRPVGEANQRTQRLVAASNRSTVEGNKNCQGRLWEAVGYLRARASGIGAYP